MSGYLLILAIIVLGGVIATLGDRLGTRIGKARLSLFNLRPKQTAVLVTILTGSIVSTSTLGLLLATNRQLRDGLTRIDEIQRNLRNKQAELERLQTEKTEAEAELQATENNLKQVFNRLRTVNRSLREAIAKQKRSEAELKQLQARYSEAQNNLKRSSQQVIEFRRQIQRFSSESQTLQAERNQLLGQRNQAEANLVQVRSVLETAIAQANARLSQANAQLQQAQQQEATLKAAADKAQQDLSQVNSQRAALQTEILALQGNFNELQQEFATLDANRKRLEGDVQVLTLGLRRGTITIRAGQVLSSGVISDRTSPEEAFLAVNQLLQQARINAIVRNNPPNLTPDQQVIQISRQDVEELVRRVSDGQSYYVRILSGGNSLQGESVVFVVPQLAPNQLVFEEADVISTVTLVPALLTEEKILGRLESLFILANRRAIESGVLPDPLTGNVGEFNQFTLFKFALALKTLPEEGEVQVLAVATTPVFTSGPLRVELVAMRNGQVLLRSG
jgi:uncharacterized protein (DUF3084 family)